jgi:hypothetical protein
MKLFHQYCSNNAGLLIIVIMSIFFYSCDTYNFSRPQPANKENIYTFPEDLQGNWMCQRFNQAVYIDSRHVAMTRKDTEHIVAGSWPRLNDKGAFIYAPFYNEGMKTIRYDSLKRPVDTIDNYLLRGNHIYAVDGKGSLGIGYPFSRDKDTLIIFKSDTLLFDLGCNAFLRKLDNNFYVLNINNSIIGDLNKEENNRWWQVVVFEKKSDQLIILWDLTTVFEQQSSMFYHHDYNYYFDSEWTTEYMMQMIKNANSEAVTKLTRK